MTQAKIELLIKDLSARLPYKCKYKASNGITHWHRLTLSTVTIDKIINGFYDEIKPYLRTMSSMTEEERKEYNEYLFYGTSIGLMSNTVTAYELIDWLNKKMFDYRGLIPMNLALEAPEGMY